MPVAKFELLTAQAWAAPPQLTSLRIAGSPAIGPDTALRLPPTLRELHVGPSNRLLADLASTLPELRLHVIDVFSNAGLQVLSCMLTPDQFHPCTTLRRNPFVLHP